MRTVYKIARICTLSLLALLVVGMAKAQTTVNSVGVSVRNSAPDDVFFMFPLSANSNVMEIQIGCLQGPMRVSYVYEENPYQAIPFYMPWDCTENYDDDFDVFMGTLRADVVVNTPDHVITIKKSTAWTAECAPRVGCRATSGSATIMIQ